MKAGKYGMSVIGTLLKIGNVIGLLFSLWLMYYGIKTGSLWIVVGFFVASAVIYNLGFYDVLGDYLEKRKAASLLGASDKPKAE